MNTILYVKRCRCKEKKAFSIKKKRKSTSRRRREERPLLYPGSNDIRAKTFQIKYEKNLSSIAKFTLNSFRNKYLYYAIDDILYLFKSNPIERDNLLAILYSPILSLHNNFSINFFDIWIHEIYINEISKVNKFLTNDFQNLEQFSYIKIKFMYKIRLPIKKPELLW